MKIIIQITIPKHIPSKPSRKDQGTVVVVLPKGANEKHYLNRATNAGKSTLCFLAKTPSSAIPIARVGYCTACTETKR